MYDCKAASDLGMMDNDCVLSSGPCSSISPVCVCERDVRPARHVEAARSQLFLIPTKN